MTELEPGTVLEISGSLEISKDYKVWVKTANLEKPFIGLQVGEILPEDLIWFEQGVEPDVETIKDVVYLGNKRFGVKQLTSPLKEFLSYSAEKQEFILLKLLENQ